MFRQLTLNERQSVLDYEEKARQRRIEHFRSGRLKGTTIMNQDTLFERARYYDLDPACESGDAEARWVPFDGRTDRTPFEEAGIAAGLPIPKYVRRYRWTQEAMRRIRKEAHPDAD